MTDTPEDLPTESSGGPAPEEGFNGSGSRRDPAQQGPHVPSAGSRLSPEARKRSPSPLDGASPFSLSPRITREDLDQVNEQLQAILEHGDLLEEAGFDVDRMRAQSMHLVAIQRGWLSP